MILKLLHGAHFKSTFGCIILLYFHRVKVQHEKPLSNGKMRRFIYIFTVKFTTLYFSKLHLYVF